MLAVFLKLQDDYARTYRVEFGEGPRLTRASLAKVDKRRSSTAVDVTDLSVSTVV